MRLLGGRGRKLIVGDQSSCVTVVFYSLNSFALRLVSGMNIYLDTNPQIVKDYGS
jgi:hypothetical protein